MTTPQPDSVYQNQQTQIQRKTVEKYQQTPRSPPIYC